MNNDGLKVQNKNDKGLKLDSPNITESKLIFVIKSRMLLSKPNQGQKKKKKTLVFYIWLISQ